MMDDANRALGAVPAATGPATSARRRRDCADERGAALPSTLEGRAFGSRELN